MKAEIYVITAQYKVRYSRDNVSAVDDHCETITAIAQANEFSGKQLSSEFFSRGDGSGHVRAMLPDGALFLGYTLQEVLEKLEAERNRLYWMFCRCARAKPVPSTLIRRIYELKEQLQKDRNASENNLKGEA